MSPTAINLINVPSDIGSIYAGKSRAPEAFRSVGLHEKLARAGFVVQESQAFTEAKIWATSSREPNGGRNEAQTVGACKSVYDTVLSAIEKDASAFQLILSGECLYCSAILSAHWRGLHGTSERVGIIYVDADCDLGTANDPTGTGNIAGMTLTHMTLRDGSLDSMKRFSKADGSGVVEKDNIVLFGLNANSPANSRENFGYLFDNDIQVITSQTVQKRPVESARKALRWMEHRVDRIIVHLDVDVIDPGEFPLCNVPSWTGLGFEEAMTTIKTFLKSEKCMALSVAEVNPDHDPGLKMTERLVEEIIEGLK